MDDDSRFEDLQRQLAVLRDLSAAQEDYIARAEEEEIEARAEAEEEMGKTKRLAAAAAEAEAEAGGRACVSIHTTKSSKLSLNFVCFLSHKPIADRTEHVISSVKP